MTRGFWRWGYLWMVLGCMLLASRAMSQAPAPGTDLDLVQAQAAELGRPLLVLVAESDASRRDNRARALIASLAKENLRDRFVVLNLDLAISRNRATAGRFHVTNTPVLFCLSPNGIIISREENVSAERTVLALAEQARDQSQQVDATLAGLVAAVKTQTNDVTAIFNLTDFLLAHQNVFEAIPYLAAVAHSNAYPPAARTRAWVALAKGHLWIGESEKCRHEAEDLMAVLGPKMSEARAGGELAMGLQDAAAKRPARAREELQEAVAAAPESDYGKEAAQALAGLPQ